VRGTICKPGASDGPDLGARIEEFESRGHDISAIDILGRRIWNEFSGRWRVSANNVYQIFFSNDFLSNWVGLTIIMTMQIYNGYS
jgi:hypothetical protein